MLQTSVIEGPVKLLMTLYASFNCDFAIFSVIIIWELFNFSSSFKC